MSKATRVADLLAASFKDPSLLWPFFSLQHRDKSYWTRLYHKTPRPILLMSWTMAVPLVPALCIIFHRILMQTLITPFRMGKPSRFFHPWQNSFRRGAREEKLFSAIFMKGWQEVCMSALRKYHVGESHLSYLSVRSGFKRRHGVHLGISISVEFKSKSLYWWEGISAKR